MTAALSRFIRRAQRALALAQAEAERLQHPFIGTEHLLLGLLREDGCTAARVLCGLGLNRARVEVLACDLNRDLTPAGHPAAVHLSSAVKDALAVAVDESRRLGHRHVGTEHLLLALLRQADGLAAQIMTGLGLNLDDVRQRVLAALQAGGEADMPRADNPHFRLTLTDKTGVVKLSLRFSQKQVRDGLDYIYEAIEHGKLGAVGQLDLGGDLRLALTLEDENP